MAQEFSHRFYKTGAWRECRNAYAAYRGHLCEQCLRRNVLSYGEIVHHKIELTPDNIDDPEVTLNWNNLELLCRQCHAEVHDKRKRHRRYTIGPDGEIIITDPPMNDEKHAQP